MSSKRRGRAQHSGDQDKELARVRREARELVGEIRALDDLDLPSDLTVLSYAALLRCADLLSSLAARSTRRDPLIPLGVRSVLETVVSGLYFLACPDQVPAVARRDEKGRRRIARHLGVEDELEPVLAAHRAIGENGGPMASFGEQLDAVHEHMAGVLVAKDLDDAKAVYVHLSHLETHPSLSLLDRYFSVSDDGGLEAVQEPPPIHQIVDNVGFATHLTSRLLQAFQAQTTKDQMYESE
jgi:hypothetical protein